MLATDLPVLTEQVTADLRAALTQSLLVYADLLPCPALQTELVMGP